MTTQTVTIFHVAGPFNTRADGTQQWMIALTPVDRPDVLLSFQTIRPWVAALCERAHATQRALRATWTPTAYGETLLDVTFAEHNGGTP